MRAFFYKPMRDRHGQHTLATNDTRHVVMRGIAEKYPEGIGERGRCVFGEFGRQSPVANFAVSARSLLPL